MLIKTVCKGNSKEVFCFQFLVYEKILYFDIVIFWVGGKNCILKNEICIVFPELRYVNSYAAMYIFNVKFVRVWNHCYRQNYSFK